MFLVLLSTFLSCAKSHCQYITCLYCRLLSGRKIENKEDAAEVMEWFHKKGVKTVVLSSTDLGSENELVGMASSIISKFHIELL